MYSNQCFNLYILYNPKCAIHMYYLTTIYKSKQKLSDIKALLMGQVKINKDNVIV